MLSKKQFLTVMEQWTKMRTMFDKLDELGMNLWETDIHECPAIIFETFIESHFNEEDADVIFWWIYEDGREMWDKDHKPIPLDTVEDLWKYLSDNREVIN